MPYDLHLVSSRPGTLWSILEPTYEMCSFPGPRVATELSALLGDSSRYEIKYIMKANQIKPTAETKRNEAKRNATHQIETKRIETNSAFV